jgi:hypothetical protein
MKKILLNKNKGKKSVNVTNIIPVEINRDMSLFQDEIMTDTINTIQVYNDEKDKTTKHRFIFTIYPLCTNVLFNKLTEIVYKEGSDKAQSLIGDNRLIIDSRPISQQGVDRIQAIRNTEYSNKEYNVSYHCGADIFNNHLLRKKGEISVQKVNNDTKNQKVKIHKYDDIHEKINGNYEIYSFNTIGDKSRNSNGENIISIFPGKDNYYYKSSNTGKTDLYIYDTIKSFKESYEDGINRKDGWMGFINPTTLHIPVDKDGKYFVNKCINNINGCEFIDLSPERELFYFTPKKNPYRKRLEYNWDYCLTYPFENVYEDKNGNLLKGKGNGLPLVPIDKDGNKYYQEYTSSNGIPLLLFKSATKHNLKNGDNVKIIGQNIVENVISTVISVGRNNNFKDRYFSIRKSDVENIINNDNIEYRFIKVVNGLECDYYYRIFKKIGDYKTVINRLAFADTIYGDEVNQIVYLDDIDINGLRDNRNRPLSEIYLTILKSNRGHKEWYENNNFNNENIEYSHVFGKITSGLDLPDYCNIDLPVIRRQHNCISNTFNKGVHFNKSSKKIEEDITIQNDSFYGDLIEFNPITASETVIENVLHRFNTAQRESNNRNYNTITYDEIYKDSLDYSNNHDNEIIEYNLNSGYANISPEGYIYNPHYKIKVRDFSDNLKQLSDTVIIFNNLSQDNENIVFKTENNYGLKQNDILTLVNKSSHNYCYYNIKSYIKENNYYICTAIKIGDCDDINNSDEYLIFRHNNNIPDYAYMLPDNSGRYIWREIINPSAYSSSSDLYNTPFTNGAFYHHLNIVFPVKRQDPFHKYDMYLKNVDGLEIENNFEIPATDSDYSADEYYLTNDSLICF